MLADTYRLLLSGREMTKAGLHCNPVLRPLSLGVFSSLGPEPGRKILGMFASTVEKAILDDRLDMPRWKSAVGVWMVSGKLAGARDAGKSGSVQRSSLVREPGPLQTPQ